MKLLNNLKFRTKLIVFFVLTFSIVILIGVQRYWTLNELVNETSEVFSESQILIDLRYELDNLNNDFEQYISNMNQLNSKRYYDSINKVSAIQKKLNIDNKFGNKKYKIYNDKNIKIKNLNNMVNSYVELLENIVESRRTSTDFKADNSNYAESNKLYSYIKEYADNIMSEQLIKNTKEHTAIKKDIKLANEITVAIIILLIGFAIFSIATFSCSVTKPIEKLVEKTVSVTKGDYNTLAYDDDATGEIKQLYDGFNMMVKSIKEHVGTLSRTRLLEQALATEKINNLNMKNALKEAELSALQSQVDPHFMFNTINVGAQLAMMNEDEDTREYLENVADVFRYNLDGLDKEVPLSKELDNARAYLKLIKTRFGDTVNYNINIDDSVDVNAIKLPKMSLQPLIENAYIHGISKNEDGGEIRVTVLKDKNNYRICVANSGVEISQGLVNRLLWSDDDINVDENKSGHTTRLGVKNVIKRLKLYLHRQDVIEISYEDGMNCFTLIIPEIENNI